MEENEVLMSPQTSWTEKWKERNKSAEMTGKGWTDGNNGNDEVAIDVDDVLEKWRRKKKLEEWKSETDRDWALPFGNADTKVEETTPVTVLGRMHKGPFQDVEDIAMHMSTEDNSQYLEEIKLRLGITTQKDSISCPLFQAQKQTNTNTSDNPSLVYELDEINPIKKICVQFCEKSEASDEKKKLENVQDQDNKVVAASSTTPSKGSEEAATQTENEEKQKLEPSQEHQREKFLKLRQMRRKNQVGSNLQTSKEMRNGLLYIIH
ncbi:hypothetical protein RFI_08526 [Reticulomyxa filosa]|uniref:Uncharacterized protein n=1 Tax=Reticulomyxa filosa TaxID=46433 RepID=X6NRN2_RETFI|nr:hypothetical protein RFI_08526 [Reticulomyxa filosa]|eukprot:ETO28603.1 hypothetical protein RFI_08526 [Reticulomyxa filosa]